MGRLDFGHIRGHHPCPTLNVHSLVQTVGFLCHTALQVLKSLWSATNIAEEPHQLRLFFPANKVSGPGADGDGRRDQRRIRNLLSHLEKSLLDLSSQKWTLIQIVDAFFFCRQMESTVQPLLLLSSRSRRLRWLGLQDRSVFTKTNRLFREIQNETEPSRSCLRGGQLCSPPLPESYRWLL